MSEIMLERAPMPPAPPAIDVTVLNGNGIETSSNLNSASTSTTSLNEINAVNKHETTYPDNSGVNTEEFIKKTLAENPRDRLFMLNVEQNLTAFLNDDKQQEYRFGPMNTYQRMLVHRISAYFCLDHNVDAATKQCVIVHKKERSRLPVTPFHKLIPGPDAIVNGINETAPNTTAADSDNPKRQILRREQSDNADSSLLTKGARHNNTNEQPIRSFEEKTADYLRAKSRIFNENKKPAPPKDPKIGQSHSATNVATNGKPKPVPKSQFTILNRNQSAPHPTPLNGKPKPLKSAPERPMSVKMSSKAPMEPLAKSQSYASSGYSKPSTTKFVRNQPQAPPQPQPLVPNFFSPNPMIPTPNQAQQPGNDMHELRMRMQHMHMNPAFYMAPPTVPVPAPPAPTGPSYMPNAHNTSNSNGSNQLFVNTGTVPPSYMYQNANQPSSSAVMKSASGNGPAHQPAFVPYPLVSPVQVPGAIYSTKQAAQQSLISIQYGNHKNAPNPKSQPSFAQKQPKKTTQPLLNYQPVPSQNGAPQFAQIAQQGGAQYAMVNVYPAHALAGFYANPNAFVAPAPTNSQQQTPAPAQPFAFQQKMPPAGFYQMHAAPPIHFQQQTFSYPPPNSQPTNPQNQPKPLSVHNSNNKFYNNNNNNNSHALNNGVMNKQANYVMKPKSFNAQMPQRKYQKQPYQNKNSMVTNRVKSASASVSPPKSEKCEEVVCVEQDEVRSVNIDQLLTNMNAQASQVLQSYEFESGLTKSSFDAQLRSGVDERLCIHYCRYDEDQCCVSRLSDEELSAMLGSGDDLHSLNQIENVFVLLEFSGDKQLNALMDMMASEQNGNFRFKCKHLTNTTTTKTN